MTSQIFKSLNIYRLSRDVKIAQDEEALSRQLEQFAFTPCGSQDMAKAGWISPLGQVSDRLYHLANDQLLLVIQRQEKMLPASVIKDELAKKIAKLETEQARKLKKTEKDALKDEVLHTLLPRAFSKNSITKIWVDIKNSLVIVDSPSAKRAEDALALLRKTLGSLPVVPVHMETPIEITATEWVRSGDAPAGFVIGDEAEMKALLEGGGVAKVKKQELCCDEISGHIEAGKVVTSLSMNWQERITFTLTDQFAIRKIKFTDSLLEQNDDIDREDAATRFDADFTLLTGELSNLIRDLTSALGGEANI